MKDKPVGFVAYCQCGKAVAATAVDKTSDVRTYCALLLWLDDGCEVVPYFDPELHGHVHGKVEPCVCGVDDEA